MSHKNMPQGGHGHVSKRSEPDGDPIADYKEWADNRYNPGYFTGGRLPPGVRWLQKSSTAYKRFLLAVLVLALVAMVLSTIWPLFR